MKSIHAAAFIALAIAASPATAQKDTAKKELAELLARNEKVQITYVINPDGSHVETREYALKVLEQKAIEHAKSTTISYSTSVERVDIVDAYTRKADGRRIDVPKSNYQMDINQGRNSGGPAFSDRTRMTVIFPELAVGDAVVLKYTLTQTEPMFPGHFSVDNRFSRSAAYDDLRIRFDAPAALWTQHAVTGMTETVNETKDGRKIIEWTWKNPAPFKNKRRDYTSYDPDKEVGYAYSTFRNYGEIAEAYGARARPKAVVSDRVRTLAEEVTKGKTEPREQARALYEWMATNISFAGNCVGVGAVVPRDQAFVLDNRMGDCKDHATLLQALLAAKGITSTQALVNSGSTYHLPKVPVLSMVNHVIVYIPSLDTYLDTTSQTTPFGMLPFGDSYKPVLYVDGYKDGLRTPPIKAEANRQYTKTEVTVKPDGSIGGTVKTTSNGTFAVSGRDQFRSTTPQARDEMVNELYQAKGRKGFGKLESDDPKPLLPSFDYKVTFETSDFTEVPGPGAFTIAPLFFSDASLSSFASSTEDEGEDAAQESSCIGGTIVEEHVYHLPKSMKVLAVPRNVTIAGKVLTYRSSYSLKGNTLTVKREAIDKTPGNLCPKSMQKEFETASRKIAADLKAQVVYQ
jgi:transglutaminase-like putative cysteine protease